MNVVVSDSDRKKHSEAEIKKGDTIVPKFCCPKCKTICDNYIFDDNAVTLFRHSFIGARFTYILIDITSSRSFIFSSMITSNRKTSLSRIDQTKEAVKQLLIEIAEGAEEDDQAILTTFDDKLKNPELIPLCNAARIDQVSNLARIDTITLSPRSRQTHLYSVLKEVYELLERKPFLYVDLYIFSDGLNTSPNKDDTAFQAIIRELNEKIGTKCHFLDCGSRSEGFRLGAWIGDKEAYCPISGSKNEIKQQIKSMYKKDHPETSRNQHAPSQMSTTYMTDAEAVSIRVPHRNISKKSENSSTDSSLQHFSTTASNIDTYLPALP